jgi:hypothetical protein
MSDSKKKSQSGSLQTIQTTKINKEPFTFLKPKSDDRPVAPLVSKESPDTEEGRSTIKIRATLYINSHDSHSPIVATHVEKDGILTITYSYEIYTKASKTYDVWYIELDYTSENVETITKVVSYLENTHSTKGIGLGADPTISRGTETSTI